MVLNVDCVRKIMLEIENTKLGARLNLDILCNLIPDYNQEEIYYACIKLHEGGYLKIITINQLGSYLPAIAEIQDLTYCGHQFLENIRDDNVWEETKKKLSSSIKNFSLELLSSTASKISLKLMGLD